MSVIKKDIITTLMDFVDLLKKILLKIVAAIIGVKFGGCGINLEKDKIKIKLIGKISFLKYVIKNCIY